MNLTCSIAVDSTGNKKNIIFCYIYNNVLYNILEMLSGEAPMSNYLLSSSDIVDVPYFIPENENSDDNVDATDLFTIAKKCNFNVSDSLIEQIVKQINNPIFTYETVKGITICAKYFVDYLSGNGDVTAITIPPSHYDNLVRTSELVDKILASGRSKEFVIPDNESKKMLDCEDELYIRVPTMEELQQDLAVLPPVESILDPYNGDKRYGVGCKVTTKFLIDRRFVFGDPTRNELPLQSNEQRYYNNLLLLINHCISEKGEDYTKEIVVPYLQHLALFACSANWMHNGCFPQNIVDSITEKPSDSDVNIDINDDSDEEVDGSAHALESGKIFVRSLEDSRLVNGAHPIVDGTSLIPEIVKELVDDESYESALTFIIKLFRWGSRKPTIIQTRYNKFLDMNQLSISNSMSSCKTSEPLKDAEGNNMFPVQIITLNDFLRDRQYISKHRITCPSISVPIGLVCARKYEDENLQGLVFLSIFDIMKAYINDEPLCKIRGISKDLKFDNEINSLDSTNVKPLIQLVESCIDGSRSFYQYKEFIESFMAKDSLNENMSILTFLAEEVSSTVIQVDSYAYNNDAELDTLITGYSVPPALCIKGNLIRKILPIVCAVNDKCDELVAVDKEPSVTDIFEMFVEKSKEYKFIGGDGFIKQSPIEPSESHSFGEPKNEETPSQTVETSVEQNELTSNVSIIDKVLNSDISNRNIYGISMPETLYTRVMSLYTNSKVSKDLYPVIVNSYSNAGKKFVIVGALARLGDEKDYILVEPNLANQAKKVLPITSACNLVVTAMKNTILDKHVSTKFMSDMLFEYYTTLAARTFKASASVF